MPNVLKVLVFSASFGLLSCQAMRPRAAFIERDRLLAVSPSNAGSGGRIRYLSDPRNPAFTQGGRKDAFEQMHGYCRGPYEVTQEYDAAEGQVLFGMAAPAQNLAIGLAQPSQVYRYLQFRCSG